jgi:broad specificity phosphatase PhoE/thiamine kinase-like enzyme
LIRHGESFGNLERNRVNTQKDSRGLTKLGKKQVDNIVKEIASTNIKFSKIISSPIPRALKTAEFISEKLQIPIKTNNLLLDINRGIIDGLTYEEIRKKHPEIVKSWKNSPPGEFAPPGGESFKDLIKRLKIFLKGIKKEENAIIVSHQDPIYAILFSLINVPSQLYYPARSLFHIDNATITAVKISKKEIFIPFVNKKQKIKQAINLSNKDKINLREIIRNNFYCAVGIGSFSYNNNYIVRQNPKKNKDYFIKLFKIKDLQRIMREEKILERLKSDRFSVTIGNIGKTKNQCFFLKPFKFCFSLHHWWRFGLTKSDKETLLKLVAKDLVKLHNLPKPIENFWQFPKDKVLNFDDWIEFLRKKTYTDLKTIINSKLLASSKLKEVKKIIDAGFKTIKNCKKREVVRLHGDFHLDNILLDKNKFRLEFIDFENARVGDRLWDLANLYKISLINSDAKYWKIFLKSYSEKAKNLKLSRENIEKILVFYVTLNFTGSLRHKIEKQETFALKEEIKQLASFLALAVV